MKVWRFSQEISNVENLAKANISLYYEMTLIILFDAIAKLY